MTLHAYDHDNARGMVDDSVDADIAAPDRPQGLLAKLVAAVRPEFRAEVLTFEPRDPVFGGPPCAVSDCARPARSLRMCFGHHARWMKQGRPDLDAFLQSTSPRWGDHRRLSECQILDCRFSKGGGKGLCKRHASQWRREGSPDLHRWLRSSSPKRAPSPEPDTCLIATCDLWRARRSPLCAGHTARWRKAGPSDLDEFSKACEDKGLGPAAADRIDLRRLSPRLRLEVQYVLQCHRDEAKAKISPPRAQLAIRLLDHREITSFLDQPGEFWKRLSGVSGKKDYGRTGFLLDAHRRVEQLVYGHGWDVEYARPVWRLRNLGIDHPGRATISFAKIPQPWMADLAKRWTRWRLSTGFSAEHVGAGVLAVTRFARFIAAAGANSLADIDRALIEAYLADLHTQYAGRHCHRKQISAIAGFLTTIRRHHWDDALPTTAMIFTEDYPKQNEPLPRALSEHVMAQVENSANLNRWHDPAYRLITLVLIRCGLRISSVTQLPFDCVVTDTDDAPYLRYYNTKMKREALVPIDEELCQEIRAQQQRVLQRWPAVTPLLIPRLTRNLDGTRPMRPRTYNSALDKWLQRCDIRDEQRRPVHLTPHQWRHTLGTRLINNDVPQEVVRKLLDHDSHAMTSHYARLHDTTVRRHWERARKVNMSGEVVTLDPDGPLAEASWAKQRLSRATQALPNGYCGLPLAKSCPHANSCLTCPMFLTTAEFLPQHRQQHQKTLKIISAAEAHGQARMVEMNRRVADNLEKIIATLEAEDDQGPVADAS